MEDLVVIKDFTGLFTKVKTATIFLSVCMLGSNMTTILITVAVVWDLNAIDQCSHSQAVCFMLAETLAHSLYAVF